MQIPFSPPDISENEINAVIETLKSGWLTTGKKAFTFTQDIKNYCETDHAFVVSSATAGLEIALRYFGIERGDEVITTPYTYAATAHVIEHCGASIVLVDTNEDDFNINPTLIQKAITSKTKAVISVDFAGFPVQFKEIKDVLVQNKSKFIPKNEVQKVLGRPLFLSDSAHSLGSVYKSKRVGSVADICVFSFQAVKNITTAEGGALVFNNTPEFNGQQFMEWLSLWSIQGQSKTAYDKNQAGNWFYDVKVPGYNINMPDILACIGIEQLKRYNEMLTKRYKIWEIYIKGLKENKNIILPLFEKDGCKTNGHLFPMRVKNPEKRDNVIEYLAQNGIASNVHFIPLPNHSYYKNRFAHQNFPVTYLNYSREISLPIYSTMKEEEVYYVVEHINKILS